MSNEAKQPEKTQLSIWQEICYIIDESDNDEDAAIKRLMKLYTVDRKNIDKTVKP